MATKVTLSVVTSRLMRLNRQGDEAFEMDCQFDGGEWSGPSHYRGMVRETQEVLVGSGWTALEYEAAVTKA